MSEPFLTPKEWQQIQDSELSQLLDKVSWTMDQWPAFTVYRLALNGQPFASSYRSGRIFCHPEFRIKEKNEA